MTTQRQHNPPTLTTTRIIDIICTLTQYCDSMPLLYSTEDQSEILNALFIHTSDDDGNPLLSVLFSASDNTLTMIETQDNDTHHDFSLISKYTISGIASLNDLNFSVITEATANQSASDLAKSVISGAMHKGV